MDRLKVLLFTQRLGILFNSGVPILDCFETLETQADDPILREVIGGVRGGIESGFALSKALEQYPRVFNKVFVAMISVGEETGGLGVSLTKLAEWQERELEFQRRLKRALTYPLVVLALAVVGTLVMLRIVIPPFLDMFSRLSVELPLATQLLMAVVHALANPGVWICLPALGVALLASLRDLYKTEGGALQLYLLLISLPVAGPLIHLGATARYCDALGTLLNCGVKILQALRLAGEASGSTLYRLQSSQAVDELSAGETLADHMTRNPQTYPPILRYLTMAGEEAARLDQMFPYLAKYYESEVSYRLEQAVAILEPVVLALVSLVVGGIVIAIMAPMYGYLSKL